MPAGTRRAGDSATVDAGSGVPAPRRLYPHWVGALLIAAAIAGLNLLGWHAAHPPVPAPDVKPVFHGLAYNAFQRWQSPIENRFPTPEAVDADLALLARHTSRVRTYSSSELPYLPALASRHGLTVTAGAWLDRRLDINEREIAAAIEAAWSNPNIDRMIAGNEAILRASLSVTELRSYLARLRSRVPVPVSTAEPWHVWLDHPELAQSVDFLTVHLLPYWEGIPREAALDIALERYRQVRERFPDKPLLIGEIGWPGRGERFGGAIAGPDEQARFIREFLAHPASAGLDYFIMEAIDQPWKRALEGGVGGHWGLFNADRELKFDYTGPLRADPDWFAKAIAASIIAFLLLWPVLTRLAHWRRPSRLALAFSLQALVSLLAWIIGAPAGLYLGVAEIVGLVLLAPALALMTAIVIAQLLEFAEMFWDGNLRRRLSIDAQPSDASDAPTPRVSIHLACCNEPPETVIASIDSLLALDWPDLEVLIIDNNTRDPALWQPVEAHVARRVAEWQASEPAGRFRQLRFFHLPTWPGYKAGALNFALSQTDPGAQWIGVIDADYLVDPRWLRSVMAQLADPGVGAVQAPQAHREWSGSRWQAMMNREYDGFFRIGMHHRHERNAIVQHGTMTLVRASAMHAAGGWAEDCVCEDSELGLRLLQAGWRVAYVDEVLGTGLVPSDFASYRKQRKRWAQGAMQILRAHAGALFGRSPLTPAQRYHFVAGWLPWIGDALHLIFTLAAMVWTIGMLAAPQWFLAPASWLLVPLVLLFAARAMLIPALYWKRVTRSLPEIAGATLAGMSLSHSIARGVFQGLFRSGGIFEITRKGKAGAASTSSAHGPAREESALFFGLLACSTGLLFATASIPGATPWAWIAALALQSVPYAAAMVCASLAAGAARSATRKAIVTASTPTVVIEPARQRPEGA
jgi:exo-beta-1,3-glucanase (GH17 family)/cellulose synthase/poly-beta-1,6-N-acetylglucosamine synthase-like glycosyltransferase